MQSNPEGIRARPQVENIPLSSGGSSKGKNSMHMKFVCFCRRLIFETLICFIDPRDSSSGYQVLFHCLNFVSLPDHPLWGRMRAHVKVRGAKTAQTSTHHTTLRLHQKWSIKPMGLKFKKGAGANIRLCVASVKNRMESSWRIPSKTFYAVLPMTKTLLSL